MIFGQRFPARRLWFVWDLFQIGGQACGCNTKDTPGGGNIDDDSTTTTWGDLRLETWDSDDETTTAKCLILSSRLVVEL